MRPAPRRRRGWDEVAEWKGLAVAKLCPPVADPPGVPSWLTHLAAGWALRVGPASADPSLFVAGAELPLSGREAAAELLADARSNYRVALNVTDFTTAMATGAVDGYITGHTPLATLRASTRATDPDDLAGLMHRARSAVAGAAADVAWAGVTTEAYSSVPMAVSISGGFWFPLPLIATSSTPAGGSCWPGPHRCAGRSARRRATAARRSAELTVGTAAQWHPDHGDQDGVRAAARKILRRCPDEDAAMQYGEERLRVAYPSIYR